MPNEAPARASRVRIAKSADDTLTFNVADYFDHLDRVDYLHGLARAYQCLRGVEDIAPDEDKVSELALTIADEIARFTVAEMGGGEVVDADQIAKREAASKSHEAAGATVEIRSAS